MMQVITINHLAVGFGFGLVCGAVIVNALYIYIMSRCK